MMLRYPILAMLAVSVGALAADGQIRTKTVRMTEYTVASPAAGGWVVQKERDPQVVIIQKTDRRRRTGTWIYVIPQDISDMYATVHSEKWMGNDIQRREHANMIVMGLNTGMYELRDVERFEADIGGKHGYAGSYQKILPEDFVEKGYLFVYFPPDFEESGVLYKFLYSTVGSASGARETDMTEFNLVVDSFTLKST